MPKFNGVLSAVFEAKQRTNENKTRLTLEKAVLVSDQDEQLGLDYPSLLSCLALLNESGENGVDKNHCKENELHPKC